MCIQIIAQHDDVAEWREPLKKNFDAKGKKMKRNAWAMRELGRNDFIAAGNATRFAGNENRRQPTICIHKRLYALCVCRLCSR